MTKQIPLSRGLFAIVDDEDFEWLSAWNWHASAQGRCCPAQKYRAARNGPKGTRQRSILMHRVITGAKDGRVVDHINGNPLDNRRANLRICTQVGNSLNGVSHADALSPYKGVSWSAQKNRWHARFRSGHIGFFKSEVEAARAYDEHVLKLEPEFARPNLPQEGAM